MNFSKTKVNIIIDGIMYLCFIFLIFSGLLIKYILLPGFERNQKYGADCDLFLLGMDRHQWGSIHFIVSLILIIGIVLHFIFHWKSIKGKINRIVYKNTTSKIIYTISLILLVGSVFGTLMIKPELATKELQHNNQNHLNENHQITIQGIENMHDEIEIWGSMSLEQTAKKYAIPTEVLVKELELNQNESNEKIGRLRKKYGFTMNELKELIQRNNNE